MKKQLLIGTSLLIAMAMPLQLSAQQQSEQSEPRPRLQRAETLTTKGFIDKNTTFNPDLLDSLVKTDDFVMLMSSFEGCIPCEILRTSDIFERFPISPYYSNYLLNDVNQSIAYTFPFSGFPTNVIFDRSGEIIAVTVGASGNQYEKLERIIAGERFSDIQITGVSEDLILPFLNLLYKANAAFLREDMENVYKYATEAMAIHPTFYSRYLLYKYHLSKNDTATAEHHKKLALTNLNGREEQVFRKLISELRGG